jgi:2-polyprenyl-3-methyl-5-hydroxy-6-metoxy-1,4-benzoquinol methylase
MPIVPNLMERMALLRLNLGPGLMLDFLGAQAFRAACAAQNLGVFAALDGAPLTAAEVAARVDADPRGTTILLEALAALGYVRRQGERFANSAMTAKWMPVLGEGMPFFHDLLHEEWSHLEESIRSGRPAVPGYETWLGNDARRWATFQGGMLAIARMSADDVVAKARLPRHARRLLDVGGGHGLYSVRFCRRHPALTATVFDLPQGLESARRTIAAEGMADRVGMQEGDFTRSGYDVVLLFNILHSRQPDGNVELLRKVARALDPGGIVVILGQLPGTASSSVGEAVSRLQALNMFNAEAAQAYRFEDIAQWLATAGFAGVRRIRLRKSPGFALVLGTRPS